MKGLIKFAAETYNFKHLNHDGDWDVTPSKAYIDGLEDGILISSKNLNVLLDQLYKECEHGDPEHRKWLKDKFDDFYNRNK